jgi:hypothetical protein
MEEPISLLDGIRQRPAMYLGERSLYGLECFLTGYSLALASYTQGREGKVLPEDFHDWVAYRLGFFSSVTGWRKMIAERVPDDSAALDRFFGLLDEHRKRKPRTIAKVNGYSHEHKAPCTLRDGVFVQQEWSYFRPPTLSLTAYTDDPGFFVDSDEPAASFRSGKFCPTLKVFMHDLGVSEENLTILNHETYSHWLRLEDRFNQTSPEGTQS